MGSALSIVNGNVTITVSTDMDQTKVQQLVDNMLTIVKDLTYTSAASSIAETTFDNLTGVQSITITQGGGIRFPNLISATTIDMKDDFESTIGVIHFGSLTSVTAFETDGVANVIEFNKATELHLTSLEYYPGATLTIVTDEGAAMPFALDDIDADGDTLEDGLTLTITGPASFTSTKIADGTFSFTDVASVNLTDYKGAVTLAGDVNSFTSNSLVSLSVTAGAKLETVDVTGVADPDATSAAPSYGPTITLSSLGDLETVTVAGIAAAITLSTNNNLTTATISADVAGAITIDNNSDLTAITLTGAKATGLDVDTNADLTALTVDLTWRAGTATGAVIDGDLDVTDNASLASLTVSSDNLENLEVTGNDELTTLDFTGVTKIGATGTAVVNIYDNDLTATKLTNTDDGTTDVADGKAGDKGSITSTSGMSTLSTYLTAVAADADSAAAVYFDTVESYVDEDDSETTDIVYSSPTAKNAGTILLLVANTADAGDAATTGKRSFIYDVGDSFFMYANGVDIIASGSAVTVDSNLTVAINDILTETALAQADAAGVTMTATAYASPRALFNIGLNSSSAENSATAATAAFAFNASDTFTITVDGISASVTSAAATTATGTFANSIMTAWNKVASPSAAYRWSLSSRAGASTDPLGTNSVVIVATAKDKGSREIGAAMSASHSAGKTATFSNVGIAIGNDQNFTRSAADNIAQGSDLLVTLTADTAGELLGEIGYYNKSQSNAARTVSTSIDALELSSSFKPNGAAASTNVETATNVYANESRLDVVYPEEANAAAASNAVSFSRVGWL